MMLTNSLTLLVYYIISCMCKFGWSSEIDSTTIFRLSFESFWCNWFEETLFYFIIFNRCVKLKTQHPKRLIYGNCANAKTFSSCQRNKCGKIVLIPSNKFRPECDNFMNLKYWNLFFEFAQIGHLLVYIVVCT